MSKKEKKLSVRHFQHPRLSEINFAGKEYKQIYFRATYNRQATELPSFSYRYLRWLYYTDEFDITSDKELFTTEDIRIINKLKAYYESNGKEFNVKLLSTNESQFLSEFVAYDLDNAIKIAIHDRLGQVKKDIGCRYRSLIRLFLWNTDVPTQPLLEALEELDSSLFQSIFEELQEKISLWWFLDVDVSQTLNIRLTKLDLLHPETVAMIQNLLLNSGPILTDFTFALPIETPTPTQLDSFIQSEIKNIKNVY
jgi:hypothetical protein